jgi:predicted O-methyltransferase YrrM
LLLASVSVVSLGVVGCTQKAENNVQAPQTETEAQSIQCQLDVPYLPTPQVVVEEMLKMAQVKGDDVLYDLGSGDGRIVITAAQKLGTRGVGVEMDPQRIQEANENAQKAGVGDRVQFLQQDLFQTDLSEATVVTLYLLPELNKKLRPRLLSQLKPGTRIVSHEFDMGEWKPQRVVVVQGPQQGEEMLYRDESCYTRLVPAPQRKHTLYYWVVPKDIPDSLQRS